MSYTVEVLLRVTVTFFTLLALARITGKKQLSQSTFFDFITAITIGDIAGEKLSDPEAPLLPWLGATFLWFGLTVTLDLIVLHYRPIAKLVEGEPTVLIENGRMVARNLRSSFLRIDELLADLRKKGHFTLSEVAYAIFETDGSVSVLPKAHARPATPEDLNLNPQPAAPSFGVIIEGRVQRRELTRRGQNEEWLREELLRQGYTAPDEVFYAWLDQSNRLHTEGYDQSHPSPYGPH